MNVVWLFLAVPWVCLQFVIVVFPDPTHLIFLMLYNQSQHVQWNGKARLSSVSLSVILAFPGHTDVLF